MPNPGSAEPDRCRTYLVDGQPVTVRGAEPLSEAGVAALEVIARAAAGLLTPEMAERQAAARIRNHARLVRLGLRDE